jgi:15-cis-phytoene synthase
MKTLTANILSEIEGVPSPKTQKSNFLYSFSFLSKDKKLAINSVYIFFDYIDNIVDSSPNDSEDVINTKMKRLDFWEKKIADLFNKNNNYEIIGLSDAIENFEIPKQYFMTLIGGCRGDLTKNRYETFEELKQYCYQVASIVGLTCIEIFGYKHEETKNYAINLGYALQLTNILRDIKVDMERGYIYLPREDMKRFGYSEEDLKNQVYNENFIQLMSFELQRARDYYHKARSFLSSTDRPEMIAAAIMDEIYFRLLEKIELNDYNIWDEKIRVSSSHKLMIALKQWLAIKLFV